MKAIAFDYADPTSVSETLGLLHRYDNTTLLAGGQSLVPYLHFRTARPEHVIDLNNVVELAGITPAPDGRITIGAMTRQRTLAESDLLAGTCPITRDALHLVGHVATRTRGTLGGSLCNLDPSAELYGVSILHDAVLDVRSARGQRDIHISDWARTYLTPAIESDELLHSISWQPWPDGHGHAFLEFSKKHHDYAIVGAGALLTVDEHQRIDQAAVVVLGVGIAPNRLPEAEAILRGRPGSPALFAEAARTVNALEQFPEHCAERGYPRRFVSASFRQHLGVVLARRAIHQAWVMATTGRAQR